jgi:excinuclease UvrABC ATPase subunit
MSEIKRYRVFGIFDESEDGYFVIHHDHMAEVERLKAEIAALVKALDEATHDYATCQSCEGNGAFYADGKAHRPGEHAPVERCGECDGEGRIPYRDYSKLDDDSRALCERLFKEEER